jgi:hypothetical protein
LAEFGDEPDPDQEPSDEVAPDAWRRIALGDLVDRLGPQSLSLARRGSATSARPRPAWWVPLAS